MLDGFGLVVRRRHNPLEPRDANAVGDRGGLRRIGELERRIGVVEPSGRKQLLHALNNVSCKEPVRRRGSGCSRPRHHESFEGSAHALTTEVLERCGESRRHRRAREPLQCRPVVGPATSTCKAKRKRVRRSDCIREPDSREIRCEPLGAQQQQHGSLCFELCGFERRVRAPASEKCDDREPVDGRDVEDRSDSEPLEGLRNRLHRGNRRWGARDDEALDAVRSQLEEKLHGRVRPAKPINSFPIDERVARDRLVKVEHHCHRVALERINQRRDDRQRRVARENRELAAESIVCKRLLMRRCGSRRRKRDHLLMSLSEPLESRLRGKDGWATGGDNGRRGWWNRNAGAVGAKQRPQRLDANRETRVEVIGGECSVDQRDLNLSVKRRNAMCSLLRPHERQICALERVDADLQVFGLSAGALFCGRTRTNKTPHGVLSSRGP
eukprot:Amastigsp_a187_12.p2 type:complete len:441 gc:universal Amastigsp_a187_12:363-1685(+)